MFESEVRLGKTVFVVFSDDWGRHPSSCQHLFRHILPHARVIWVNTIGLRTPRLSLYDIRRALQVILSWIRPGGKKAPESPSEPVGPRPEVLRPAMWPSFRKGWSAALNHWLLSRAVHAALRGLEPGKEAVLVSTLPIVPALFRDPVFRKKVYYCVDDFTEWHGIDGEAMRRLEKRTLDACDLMIATSSPILEARASLTRASSLLTHGVDAGHFSGAAPDPGSPLAGLPKPLIGMFGVFDRRIDGRALRAAAARLPNATFVVIGPVVDRPPGEFRDVPNLRFFGPVPYSALPGHVAHFDACILPYVVDRTTHNINPLKLKEYLATGKPVVATPLPEAVRLGNHLVLADSSGFAEAVAACLEGARPDPAGLEAFLRGESWEAKAGCFVREILKET